jgi:GntR family transcriptional repressor for pyruvate dehydrogenase complex
MLSVLSSDGLQRPRLREKVTERLASWIVDGAFSPGEMLPPEGELATRLGVSRATVREAVKTLAARGLIEVRHGGGLLVGASSAAPVSDALALLLQRRRVGPEALLEARQLLEVEIAGLAAERATPADLAELEAALADLGRDDRPLEAQIAADTRFHLALARAAHNPVYLAVSEAVRAPLVESMRATYPVDGGPARRQREHRAIFDAVRARRRAAARAHMVLMLDTTAEAIRRIDARTMPRRAQPS